MVANLTTRVFPEDIDFSQAMQKVYAAKKKLSGDPIDYSRRGGMALLEKGDRSAWLLNAVQQAKASADADRDERRRLAKERDAMTRAMAMRQHAENIRNVVGGTGKLVGEGVRHWATTGRREMDEGDFPGSAEDLLASGAIRRAPGGRFQYTPGGLFEEMFSPERMFGLRGEIDTLGIRGPNPGGGY